MKKVFLAVTLLLGLGASLDARTVDPIHILVNNLGSSNPLRGTVIPPSQPPTLQVWIFDDQPASVYHVSVSGLSPSGEQVTYNGDFSQEAGGLTIAVLPVDMIPTSYSVEAE